MRKRLPDHATVVAYLALFIALGGGAYAAVKLPKNSVGSAQIKKNAVSSAEVKDHSLKAADFAARQLKAGPQGPKGDVGPKGDTGAAGADGAPGSPGAPGSAVAYAHILVSAGHPSIDAAKSKNVDGVRKPSATVGIYCLHVTAPFTNAVATVDDQEGASPGFTSLALAPGGTCADLAGANVEIRTYNATGTLADRQFFANFN